MMEWYLLSQPKLIYPKDTTLNLMPLIPCIEPFWSMLAPDWYRILKEYNCPGAIIALENSEDLYNIWNNNITMQITFAIGDVGSMFMLKVLEYRSFELYENDGVILWQSNIE